MIFFWCNIQIKTIIKTPQKYSTTVKTWTLRKKYISKGVTIHLAEMNTLKRWANKLYLFHENKTRQYSDYFKKSSMTKYTIVKIIFIRPKITQCNYKLSYTVY